MGRAAQRGDAGARALGEPRAIDLVMTRRRAEIPNDRFVVLRQEREAHQFIHGPGADVGSGDVADVVHVETEKRAHLGGLESVLDACQTFTAEAVQVDALFPIDAHQAKGLKPHRPTSIVPKFQSFQSSTSSEVVSVFRERLERLERLELLERIPHRLLQSASPLPPPLPALARSDPRAPVKTARARPSRPSVSPAHRDNRRRRRQ